jgi:hypothetical protein
MSQQRHRKMPEATLRCTRNVEEPEGIALDRGERDGQQTIRSGSVGACVFVESAEARLQLGLESQGQAGG